ncbi:FadR/GntR family transcriptional regulator [Lactonifactor longoviformis]|uniref:FadR/GntR family transcriptional regulator n=1 Tax=Lactonifactor longoviformis TaxID=341220 RepID=UPI001D020E42|nr:FCD domain-containing protein [Lactonifactor longoviformis]MCB5714266.1 FCD domain-containing protein [Lactonifactor longoviformis]MCB5718221.1 FCD domain-containing protein [Lactonifactor longoviformis]
MLESLNNNKKLLPEQVSEQIIRLLTERQLKAGDKLPNEFDMAQQLSVGRGTIREAIKILVSRNIVEIRRGCGTFVCDHPGMVDDPLGFRFMKDKGKLALDLCEVRMIIEPEIAALAAERATEEEIEELEKVAKEVEVLCEQELQHMEKDIEFHGLIAKCSKNTVMPNIIPVIQSGISIFINITEYSLTQETIRTHRMILNAIKNHDPQEARAAMIEHLVSNREKIKTIIA